MAIELPYPARSLWPNARPHWAALSVAKRKARNDAYLAARAANLDLSGGEYRPHITVHGLARGPLPDKDNCVAAAKAYLDGIADALKVNDRHFAAPTVSFAPVRSGKFIITFMTGESNERHCEGQDGA